MLEGKRTVLEIGKRGTEICIGGVYLKNLKLFFYAGRKN